MQHWNDLYRLLDCNQLIKEKKNQLNEIGVDQNLQEVFTFNFFFHSERKNHVLNLAE